MMDRKPTLTLTTLLAATALIAAPLSGQDPFMAPNESWITLDGTVQSVTRDAFTLNYDDGYIRVEMDDGDRDADAYQLVEGDKVTVTGRIDDDFLELAKIEASSVFVENIGTYFYASATDEEDWRGLSPEPSPYARTVLRGTVTEVRDGEFDIASGLNRITVDVEGLAYDPLDDEGYQKVGVGDYVSVVGEMDYDMFEGRAFEATTLIMLHDVDSDAP